MKAFFLFACLAAALDGPVMSAAAEYEASPGLQASDVLSPRLLRSESHRVHDEIGYDGHFIQFSLETDHGIDSVTSKALLRIRVHEAAAIGQASLAARKHAGVNILRPSKHLGRSSTDDQPTSGSRRDLDIDVSAAEFSIVGNTRPLPSRSMRADRSRDSFPGSTNPISKTPIVQAVDVYKRTIAAKLQVDVYTSNRVLRQTLNALARNGAMGDVSMDSTFFIEREAETTVTRGLVDAGVRRALKDNSTDELRELNDQVLSTLSIVPELRQRFLDHPALSPRHKTYIVAYLQYLKTGQGLDSILFAALAAKGEAQALFYEQLARALAVYNQDVDAIAELRIVGSTLIAHTTRGTLVIVQPVDVVYWTEYFDSLTGPVAKEAERTKVRGREVVVTGMITTRARRELAGRGFTVREKFLARR